MKKKLIIGIIAISLLITGCNQEKCIETVEKENVEKEQTKIEVLDILEAEKVIGNINVLAFNNDSIYPEKEFELKNTSKEELVTLASQLLIEKGKENACLSDYNNLKDSITIEEVNKSIKDYNKFLPELTIEDIQNNKNYNGSISEFVVKSDKIYVIMHCDGQLGPSREYVHQKVIKATIENNKLIIDLKGAFGYISEKASYNIEYDYYTNNDKSKLIETDEQPRNWEKYNTYRFIYEVENGVYTLEKIINLTNK